MDVSSTVSGTLSDTGSNAWNLMKSDNGIILACFIAGVLSLNVEDLKNPICVILCILICSVILGGIIASICPDELKPYVASILIAIAGIGAAYRLIAGDPEQKRPPIFSFEYRNCDTNTKQEIQVR